jgi:hypothetical protein
MSQNLISKTNYNKWAQERAHIVHFGEDGRSLCRKVGKYFVFKDNDWKDNSIICEECLTLAGEH